MLYNIYDALSSNDNGNLTINYIEKYLKNDIYNYDKIVTPYAIKCY